MPIWIYLGKGSRESEEQKGPLDQLLQNQCLATRKMKQPAIKQHQRLFCDVIKGLCQLTRYLHTQLKNRVLNHHHENSEPIPSNYVWLKLRPNSPKSFISTIHPAMILGSNFGYLCAFLNFSIVSTRYVHLEYYSMVTWHGAHLPPTTEVFAKKPWNWLRGPHSRKWKSSPHGIPNAEIHGDSWPLICSQPKRIL